MHSKTFKMINSDWHISTSRDPSKKKYNHKSLLVGLYHDKKSWFRPKIKKLTGSERHLHFASIRLCLSLLFIISILSVFLLLLGCAEHLQWRPGKCTRPQLLPSWGRTARQAQWVLGGDQHQLREGVGVDLGGGWQRQCAGVRTKRGVSPSIPTGQDSQIRGRNCWSE